MHLFYFLSALLLTFATAANNLRGRNLSYECDQSLSGNAESGICSGGNTFPICRRGNKKTFCVTQDSWQNTHNIMGATCGPCETVTKNASVTTYADEVTQRTKNTDVVFSNYDFDAPMCNVTYNDTDIDFTLVTQLLEDRLWMMEEQCKRWGNHSMSVAIGTDDGDDEEILDKLQDMGCNLEHVKVVFLFDIDEQESPANALRNAAMEQVNTTHAFYLDVDFMVSPALYEHLSNHTQSLTDPKLALILPAFEMRGVCDSGVPTCKKANSTVLPHDKDELLELFGKNETIEPAVVPLKNKNTVFSKDFFQNETFAPVSCIAGADKFEPYLVIRYCRDIPSFQETLTGYSNNKVAWTQQIRRLGYQMTQLSGDSFAVRFPNRVNKLQATRAMNVLEQELEKQRFREARASWNFFLESSVPLPTVAGAPLPGDEEEERQGENMGQDMPYIIPSCQAVNTKAKVN